MLDLEKLYLFNQMMIHYTDSLIIFKSFKNAASDILSRFFLSLPLSLFLSVIYTDIFEMKKEWN